MLLSSVVIEVVLKRSVGRDTAGEERGYTPCAVGILLRETCDEAVPGLDGSRSYAYEEIPSGWDPVEMSRRFVIVESVPDVAEPLRSPLRLPGVSRVFCFAKSAGLEGTVDGSEDAVLIRGNCEDDTRGGF